MIKTQSNLGAIYIALIYLLLQECRSQTTGQTGSSMFTVDFDSCVKCGGVFCRETNSCLRQLSPESNGTVACQSCKNIGGILWTPSSAFNGCVKRELINLSTQNWIETGCSGSTSCTLAVFDANSEYSGIRLRPTCFFRIPRPVICVISLPCLLTSTSVTPPNTTSTPSDISTSTDTPILTNSVSTSASHKIASTPSDISTSTDTSISTNSISTSASYKIASTPSDISTSTDTPILTNSVSTSASHKIASTPSDISTSTDTSISTNSISTSASHKIASTPSDISTSTDTPILTNSVSTSASHKIASTPSDISTSTDTSISTNSISTSASHKTDSTPSDISTSTDTSISTNSISTSASHKTDSTPSDISTSTDTPISTNSISTSASHKIASTPSDISTSTDTSISTNSISTSASHKTDSTPSDISTSTDTSISTNSISTSASHKTASTLSDISTPTDTSISTNSISTSTSQKAASTPSDISTSTIRDLFSNTSVSSSTFYTTSLSCKDSCTTLHSGYFCDKTSKCYVNVKVSVLNGSEACSSCASISKESIPWLPSNTTDICTRDNPYFDFSASPYIAWTESSCDCIPCSLSTFNEDGTFNKNRREADCASVPNNTRKVICEVPLNGCNQNVSTDLGSAANEVTCLKSSNDTKYCKKNDKCYLMLPSGSNTRNFDIVGRRCNIAVATAVIWNPEIGFSELFESGECLSEYDGETAWIPRDPTLDLNANKNCTIGTISSCSGVLSRRSACSGTDVPEKYRIICEIPV